jgi:hypothetical protein
MTRSLAVSRPCVQRQSKFPSPAIRTAILAAAVGTLAFPSVAASQSGAGYISQLLEDPNYCWDLSNPWPWGPPFHPDADFIDYLARKGTVTWIDGVPHISVGPNEYTWIRVPCPNFDELLGLTSPDPEGPPVTGGNVPPNPPAGGSPTAGGTPTTGGNVLPPNPPAGGSPTAGRSPLAPHPEEPNPFNDGFDDNHNFQWGVGTNTTPNPGDNDFDDNHNFQWGVGTNATPNPGDHDFDDNHNFQWGVGMQGPTNATSGPSSSASEPQTGGAPPSGPSTPAPGPTMPTAGGTPSTGAATSGGAPTPWSDEGKRAKMYEDIKRAVLDQPKFDGVAPNPGRSAAPPPKKPVKSTSQSPAQPATPTVSQSQQPDPHFEQLIGLGLGIGLGMGLRGHGEQGNHGRD